MAFDISHNKHDRQIEKKNSSKKKQKQNNLLPIAGTAFAQSLAFVYMLCSIAYFLVAVVYTLFHHP